MNATPTLIETPPHPVASLGALGVAPCSSDGIIETLLRFISPPDFDSATEEVARSVCTSYYQTFNTNCFTAVNPTPTMTCQIMVAYMNAATNTLLHDYEPGMNPSTGKRSPYGFSWNELCKEAGVDRGGARYATSRQERTWQALRKTAIWLMDELYNDDEALMTELCGNTVEVRKKHYRRSRRNADDLDRRYQRAEARRQKRAPRRKP